MAQSRLSKAASIFTRVNGLVRSELIPWKDRPIWLDIYKAFPPLRDPQYRSVLGRDPVPSLPPKILYKEDEIRVYFFKNIVGSGDMIVLNSTLKKPIWEIFIEVYKNLAKQNVSKENLIEASILEMQNKGFTIKMKKEETPEPPIDIELLDERYEEDPNISSMMVDTKTQTREKLTKRLNHS